MLFHVTKVISENKRLETFNLGNKKTLFENKLKIFLRGFHIVLLLSFFFPNYKPARSNTICLFMYVCMHFRMLKFSASLV